MTFTQSVRRRLRRFGTEDSGATAIEYALIASLIAIAAVALLETVGGGVTAAFQDVADELPAPDAG